MNKKPELPIDHDSSDGPLVEGPPVEVPSFGCIVYVKRNTENRVVARVANLAGIEIEAASEREALTKIVPQFKQAIQSHLQSGTAIAWIDPPNPIADGEQKRFLPMHL